MNICNIELNLQEGDRMGRDLTKILMFTIFLVAFVAFSSSAWAQSEPPNDGNWEIDGKVTVSDKEIVLNGDLIIKSGGDLNLHNVDLKLNCKSDREYKIKVENPKDIDNLLSPDQYKELIAKH